MLNSTNHLTIYLLLLTLFITSSLAGRFDTYLSPRRHTYSFTAPTNYKISWNISSKRASLGSSTKTISYSSLAKSGSITQSQVNQCVSKCGNSKQCTFVQVIQMMGSSYGSVICSLHQDYVNSDMATYAKGSKGIGGTVKTTYGIRKTSTTTSTRSSTSVRATSSTKKTTTSSTQKSTTTSRVTATSTTSKSITKTSTTSKATGTTSSDTFPTPPKGAQLVQLQPCLGTLATIPMFVNNQYHASTTTSAYIVQHGHERDFETYFSAVYQTIGENGIIVAPNSYLTSDSPAPKSYYQPLKNLAWGNESSTWSVGDDAIGPVDGNYSLNGVQCSSYDTYDALLDHLADITLFPNLNKVYFVSHSGGANMVSRYSQIYNVDREFAIRYIVANSASNAYFTDSRPENEAELTKCTSNSEYPYQLVQSGMPRYVLQRFTNIQDTFIRWINRDVIILTGNLDTNSAYPGGVENCASQAQGGFDRRNRNYAWWAYQNILAGTLNNVTRFHGYDELIANNATILYQSNDLNQFNHQNCIADNVGHDAVAMFSSPCGIAAMTQDVVPAGASP